MSDDRDDRPRPRAEHNREYLTRLLVELREKVARLEQQKVSVITAPVTAVDLIGSTFTVTMPTQEDGTLLPLSGISAPADFMPGVGDNVQLQLVGAVPQYQPASIAQDVVTDREIAPGTKVHVWRQPNQPTAVDVGDVWIDSDDGNKEYIWGPVGTVVRQNVALNPSFESDAAGTVTTVSSWANYSTGTVGTVTRSIVTTGGVTSGTKAAKIVSSSLAATANTAAGIQQTFTAAPGDIFRISADMRLAVTGSNFVPHMLVEWLNSSNTVIGSTATSSGSGTVTTSQSIALTTAAAPALTAHLRLTLSRRAVATTGSALVNADVTVDSVLVEQNLSVGAQGGYFDGGTLSNGDTKWDIPADAPDSTSTYFQDSVPGTNAWWPNLLRNGGVQPGSLSASNVIASGTVTASLLEALMVLTNIVIAGDPAGDHATMESDGFHVYRDLAVEGVTEVGRLATSGSNFFAIADGSGAMVASIADDGSGNFANLNVKNDPVIMGTPFTQWIGTASNIGNGNALPGQTTYGTVAVTGSGITAEVGICEVPVYVDASRWYLLAYETSAIRSTAASELRFRIRDGGASTPTLASGAIMYRQNSSSEANFSGHQQSFGLWTPNVTGTRRLLLTIECVGGGTATVDLINSFSGIYAIDMGPKQPTTNAQVNTGGGGTPVPPQSFYVDEPATGHWSYRGSGTLRTDTTDVVQGWDPSGFNGDGHGGWNFTIPNISGTVDRVDVYIYSTFTYFNSGANAWLSVVSNANTSTPTVLQGPYNPGVTYPKNGPVTITLPSSTYATFKSKTSIGIYLGPIGSTNETFYLRADGPSPRLRIWYHQ